MLTAEDKKLIERDRKLPQLRVLLDRAYFTPLLEARAPEMQISEVQLTYLRYKPGVNCIAGYEYHVAGARRFCYAKIFPTDQADKLEKFLVKVGGDAVDGIGFAFFPHDSRLRSLKKFDGGDLERGLLARMFSSDEALWDGEIRPIRYKPERRFVARLVLDEETKAVVKMHTSKSFNRLRDNGNTFESKENLKVARRLGYSKRHNVIAFEWLTGDLLSDTLRTGTLDPGCMVEVGRALAQVHTQRCDGLSLFSAEMEAGQIAAIADQFAVFWPEEAARAVELSRQIGAQLCESKGWGTAIHGDFYAKQVLLDGDQVGILDFDESAYGDPLTDVGNFIAHLERDQARYDVSDALVRASGEALVDGYASVGMPVDLPRINLFRAANLFKLLLHPFRFREAQWPAHTRSLLDRISHALGQSTAKTVYPSVPTSHDPEMPFMEDALDPEAALAPIARAVTSVRPELHVTAITAATLLRHKPGRRCLIEYILQTRDDAGNQHQLTVLGKARYKKVKTSNYALMESMWAGAFNDTATDGVHVPAPMGVVPEYNMWLQRKEAGTTATDYLHAPAGELAAAGIAHALYKLNTQGPATGKLHTIEDELEILEGRLASLAAQRPSWRSRIEKIMKGCRLLADSPPETVPVPVHRDFYPDNVLIGEDTIFLLDLDLYCMGDPALDAGNFIGHIIEYSLRTFNDAERLDGWASAFEAAYLQLAGSHIRESIDIYTTLTLARHIQISTLFEARRAFTSEILALCEQRLARDRVSTVSV